MHVPHKALGKPGQMTLIEPPLAEPVVILNQNQMRELESTLAQPLLSALQPAEQSSASQGGEDVIEDHA
jgi:hypothetical protein